MIYSFRLYLHFKGTGEQTVVVNKQIFMVEAKSVNYAWGAAKRKAKRSMNAWNAEKFDLEILNF